MLYFEKSLFRPTKVSHGNFMLVKIMEKVR